LILSSGLVGDCLNKDLFMVITIITIVMIIIIFSIIISSFFISNQVFQGLQEDHGDVYAARQVTMMM
jgi:hypothetical protein